MWVDLSVWFSAHEGRSFDSDVSYMPSRLGRAYVPADGIFYLPKRFDLVSVVFFHGYTMGSIPEYPQIPFGLPSFLQEQPMFILSVSHFPFHSEILLTSISRLLQS